MTFSQTSLLHWKQNQTWNLEKLPDIFVKCSEPEIKNYKADNNWHEEGNAVHEPVAAFDTLLIFVVKSHDEGDELAASEEIARPTMLKIKTFDEGNLLIPVVLIKYWILKFTSWY